MRTTVAACMSVALCAVGIGAALFLRDGDGARGAHLYRSDIEPMLVVRDGVAFVRHGLVESGGRTYTWPGFAARMEGKYDRVWLGLEPPLACLSHLALDADHNWVPRKTCMDMVDVGPAVTPRDHPPRQPQPRFQQKASASQTVR